MKRRSHPIGRKGISPYSRYEKTPTSYGAMYVKNPNLRRPNSDKIGSSNLPTLEPLGDEPSYAGDEWSFASGDYRGKNSNLGGGNAWRQPHHPAS